MTSGASLRRVRRHPQQPQEVIAPADDVTFIAGAKALADARTWLADQPHSRFPVIGDDFDDVTGFVRPRHPAGRRPPGAPWLTSSGMSCTSGTNRVLPTVVGDAREGAHLAIVIDEFRGPTAWSLRGPGGGSSARSPTVRPRGGHAQSQGQLAPRVPGGVTLEELASKTGVELPDGTTKPQPAT